MNERPADIGAVREGWPLPQASSSYPGVQFSQADDSGASDARHVIDRDAPMEKELCKLGTNSQAKVTKDETLELLRIMSRGKFNEHWVGTDRLVYYLAHKVLIMEQLRQLPLAICFFVVFVLLMTLHVDLHSKQQLSEAVEQSMGLQEPVPTGFSAVWEQIGRRAESALAVPYTRVLGGVRVARLLESESEPSEVLCSKGIGNFIEDALRGVRSPRPSVCHNRSSEFTWIHWSLQAETVQLALAQLRSSWEPQTGPLTAEFADASGLAVQSISFNDKVHAYTLYKHAVHFDLTGFMINETRVHSFDARPAWLHTSAENTTLVVLDVVFCVLLALFSCLALFNCCLDRRAMGCRALLKSGCSAWPAVALLMVCMCLMMVISYAYCNLLVEGMNKLVAELPAVDMQQRYNQSGLEEVSNGRSAYEQQLNVLLEQAQRVHFAQLDLRWYTGVAMICVCLRLLRALHATVSQLDILMNKVWRAAEDLAHLLIMICTALLVFLLTGHLIFGGRIEVFSSGGRALESTVLFLFGFMFDSVHKKLQNLGGGLGIAWVWLFNILMVLLLLSVALVVVLHAYMGKEVTNSQSDDSLFPDAHRRISGVFNLNVEELVAKNQIQDSSNSAVQAAEKYSEKKVYQELVKRGVGLRPRVSSTSLAVMLGAKPGDEWRRIDWLVSRAAMDDPSPSLLSSSTRLCGRLEANVQELGSRVEALSHATQASEASGLTESVADWKGPPAIDWSKVAGHGVMRPLQEAELKARLRETFSKAAVDGSLRAAIDFKAVPLENLMPCRPDTDLGYPIRLVPPEPPAQQPPALLQPLSLMPCAPDDDDIEEVLALEPIQAERRRGPEDEDEIITALELPDDVEPPVISKMVWTRTLPLVSAIDALAEMRIGGLSQSIDALERNFNPVLAQAAHDPQTREIPTSSRKSMQQLCGLEANIAKIEDMVTEFSNQI